MKIMQYPHFLDAIFDKLQRHGAQSIIVGGFVRDFFLSKSSKDIDIEVYNISSYEKLEELLEEFGSVNSFGKSFGVCKLQIEGMNIDFTLPRRDSKIAQGHKGFDISLDFKLDFLTAFSRRDFTINAIGYDVFSKKIVDPFEGLHDLNQKILKAVDRDKFADDPLRILRAVQFSARFDLTMDEDLLALCKDMCAKIS